MPSALFSKPNNLITNFLLNISAEFSCVYFFHAQEITKYYRYVKYLFAELITKRDLSVGDKLLKLFMQATYQIKNKKASIIFYLFVF